jgi:hypothetical protein
MFLLRFTDSDFPFGIFKLFLQYPKSTPTFNQDNCVQNSEGYVGLELKKSHGNHSLYKQTTTT